MSTAPFREVMSRPHLPALDGIRAIAVFVVVIGHARYPFRDVPTDLGVNAFFVLSGFLITRLLMQEHAARGTISLSGFYARRTLRIFPAYYAFLAASFALDYLRHDYWTTGLGVSGLTYTMNYYNALHGHPSTSIAHAWSLSVEEQFYLLWPLAFILLSRRGPRAIVQGVLATAALTVGWRSWLTFVAGAEPSYMYNAFDTRLDSLAVGCLLALVADRAWMGSVAASLARYTWLPFMTGVLILVSRWSFPESYHYSVGFTVEAVLCAVLIVQLMQLSATRMWSWLESRPMRYLGTISYPIYLYHAIGGAVGRHSGVSGAGAQFLVAVGATVAIASGSYFVIERPFLKLKKRFAVPGGRSPLAPDVAKS